MSDLLSGIGTWLSTGSPVVAELAALSGFEWLLLDMEHGCGSEADVLNQLRAVSRTNARVIVRVGAPHADLISRLLDWGASGIMAPHIDSVEQARELVACAHYPPMGHRGYSRTVRAYDYGLKSPESVTSKPLVVAQIESLAGVEHSADIATVAGVDALFVGPADLGFDLALKREKAAPDFDECLKIVAQSAKGAGKEVGILLRDHQDLLRLRELGYHLIAIDSDISILRKSYQQIISNLTNQSQP